MKNVVKRERKNIMIYMMCKLIKNLTGTANRRGGFSRSGAEILNKIVTVKFSESDVQYKHSAASRHQEEGTFHIGRLWLIHLQHCALCSAILDWIYST